MGRLNKKPSGPHWSHEKHFQTINSKNYAKWDD